MMKVKKNKKLLAILLTTVMSLAALTGCGESPVESETGQRVRYQQQQRLLQLQKVLRRKKLLLISGIIIVHSRQKMKL